MQAALHKKQLHVHELKTRLNNCNIKLSEYQKTTHAKDSLIDATVKQLDKEMFGIHINNHLIVNN